MKQSAAEIDVTLGEVRNHDRIGGFSFIWEEAERVERDPETTSEDRFRAWMKVSEQYRGAAIAMMFAGACQELVSDLQAAELFAVTRAGMVWDNDRWLS